MKFTNAEIYQMAVNLQTYFNDGATMLPIKVNFYIQKNKTALYNLATEIEEARMTILNKYGKLKPETNEYEFDEANSQLASTELQDLYNLEQDVKIYMVDIDNFGDDLQLTQRQMETLMFMIK